MKHSLLISVAVLASITLGAWQLPASQIDFSLNLLYADPQDDQSGGSWELVARADEEGMVGVSVQLTDILDPQFQTPRGEVMGMPVGFEINEVIEYGTHTNLAATQFPQDPNITQPLFYDVGVIGGGTMPGDNDTPSFDFDDGTIRNIPWGMPDTLGDPAWAGAVLLATGMFAPETAPAFFTDGMASRGVLFTSVGDATTPGTMEEAAIVETIVRDNLMAMMGLVGDYNNSGTVEQADLDLVLLNWGQDGTTPPTGWVNNLPSGLIDQGELDGVLLNWGDTTPGALGGAQGVPEPSTLLLLLTMGALAFGVRKMACCR